MDSLQSHLAMDTAMDLAREAGIGMVGVHRSTQSGMGALYAFQAIEKVYVWMILTDSSSAIAMWGGRSTFLGASPIAASVPGRRPSSWTWR